MKVTKKTRLLAKAGPKVVSSDGRVKIMSVESAWSGFSEPIPLDDGGMAFLGEGLNSNGSEPLELPREFLVGGKVFGPEAWGFSENRIDFGIWYHELPAPGIYNVVIPITYTPKDGGATETLNVRTRIKIT